MKSSEKDKLDGQEVASATPDQSTSDREALIELDVNALICKPLIQSHEIENAILSEICTASLSDDISIPSVHVFDMDVVKYAVDGVIDDVNVRLIDEL